jgi:hypothetical protein
LNAYRNRVRTPEERKHPLRKKIEADRKERGILNNKQIIAHRNRTIAKAKKSNRPKKGEFNVDLWEGIYIFIQYMYTWLKGNEFIFKFYLPPTMKQYQDLKFVTALCFGLLSHPQVH